MQSLLRGNEELVMVEGGQELIFPSSLSIFLSVSPTFLSFTTCFVWLGRIKAETVECQAFAGEWERLGGIDRVSEFHFTAK